MSMGDRRLYMGLETSEKIFVTFGLEVTNKGGHSSLPEPDNAIYRLAAGLGRIAKLSFPERLNATTKAYFAADADEPYFREHCNSSYWRSHRSKVPRIDSAWRKPPTANTSARTAGSKSYCDWTNL